MILIRSTFNKEADETLTGQEYMPKEIGLQAREIVIPGSRIGPDTRTHAALPGATLSAHPVAGSKIPPAGALRVR